MESLLFAREGKGGGGVSLEPEDAISVGIFGPGPATIVESVFAEYNYGGKSKAVPVWLITYDRDGEKYEQPYSVGNGWRVSSDGESLIPKNGQTGLPDSCNAMLLLTSLREAGLAKGFLKGGNPRTLEDMKVILKREAQPDRGLDTQKKDGPPKAARTILLVEEIVSLRGEGKKSTGKSKAKAKDEDEDEDDEKPKSKSKKPADDEEDEDEDEAPAKGKGGKKKPAADDSEENGVEALIEVLEANKGKIEIDDVERLVKRHLKGQDDADEIAELCASDDFLALEKGWTTNAKKGIIALD